MIVMVVAGRCRIVMKIAQNLSESRRHSRVIGRHPIDMKIAPKLPGIGFAGFALLILAARLH